MRNISLITLLLLFALPSYADQNRFWLGVLRVDGVLTPFALYDNGRWTAPWPEDLGTGESGITDEAKQLKLPPFSISKNYRLEPKTASLSDLPPEWLGSFEKMPTQWYLLSKSKEPHPISVTKAIQYESHCIYNWGLLTDYKQAEAAAVKENWWPRPKAGIAMSAVLEMTPIEKIEPESQEGQEIVSIVKETFEKLETEQVRKIASKGHVAGNHLKYTGHPLSERERRKTGLLAEKILKSHKPIGGKEIFYIESRRRYSKPAGFHDQGCAAITAFSAWIVKQHEQSSILNANAFITDCDMKGADTTHPDFVLSVDHNHYVISENYGYEWEYYTVGQITDDGIEVILERSGGGC